MKKLNKYIMLFVAAFALVSCVDDGIDNPALKAEAGDEVQFGLSLPSSRTVYGDEANNAYPIYWVNNDKVFIFSPQCLDGHRGAEYAVSVDGAEQNYATSITKTGDIGVQWGDNETADFYSLYPSGLYGLSDDGKIAKGIVINTSQNIVITKDAAGKRIIKSDMEDCLLYAKKLGVQSGTTVELQYSPITTVFMLTLSVGGESAEEYTIQSIALKAPEGTDIAGKFGINVANGTFAEWSETKDNIVSAAISDKTSGGFLTLTKGESVEVPLFIAPIRNANVDNGAFSVDGWTIEVKSNGKTYSKTLGDLTVVPGQIHKITLPALSSNKAQEWDVATWMVNIPRNVYLSEISIPGTWNSLNPEFQTKTSIDEQYSNGVRAFHFETRWRRTGSIFTGGYNYSLGIADGNSTGTSGSKYCTSASPEFSTEFNNIINKVRKDEYMVLVCSFAQGSAQRDGANGWIKVISELCENDKVFDARKLSSKTVVGDVLNKVIVIVNVESFISTDTVPSSTLAENSKCLFTYTPSEVPKTRFVVDVTDEEQKRTTLLSNNSDILWTTTTTTTTTTDIKMYSTQAQISSNGDSGITTSSRGYAPTLAERKNILDIITSWSKSNYGTANYAHDQWIYMGLGGYRTSAADASTVSGSHAVVENTMNTWVNQVVDEMGKNDVPFYPVGIVLMNNKKGSNYTDSNGTDLKYGFTNVVKNILLLNNKYRLQYDPTKPEDYVYIDEGTGGSGGSGGDEF